MADQHVNDKSKTQRDDVIKRNNKPFNIKAENLDPSRYGTNYIYNYNNLALTVFNINKMTLCEREQAAKSIFNFYRNGGFPYPKFNNEELKKDWDEIKKLNIHDDSVIIDKKLSTNNQKGIDLFKHFMESFYTVRDDSKSSRSMLEAFNDDKILMDVIRNRLGITFVYRGEHFPFNICGSMIKQGMRSTRLAPQTSTFRPSVAKFFYENYSPENGVVYDPCMGFGQRLLGALSSKKNLTYIACDPWQAVHDEVSKMTNYLQSIDCTIKDRYYLNKTGSENFDTVNWLNKVDVCFSSIPYFNKEVYCQDSSQCYSGGYKDFINVWWNNTVEKISKVVKSNGVFVLNVSEKHKKNQLLKDLYVIAKQHGFVEVDRYYLNLSRSHLTKKVGTNNLNKLEPIVVMKKI